MIAGRPGRGRVRSLVLAAALALPFADAAGGCGGGG